MAPQGYLLVNGEPLGSERVNIVKKLCPRKERKEKVRSRGTPDEYQLMVSIHP